MDSKIKTDLYTIDFNAIDFNDVIVPTPLEGGGGGTIYSNGFFCSDNFGRSIYSS